MNNLFVRKNQIQGSIKVSFFQESEYIHIYIYIYQQKFYDEKI
jgi:hypothetical protein